MNIEVIGGGALGLLFAAGAAAGGARTVLYTRTEEQSEIVASSGIERLEHGGQGGANEAPVRLAARSVDRFGPADGVEGERWILLAVKQKDLNDNLIERLRKGTRPGDRLLCLQNGIGHIERLSAALQETAVYAAITTEGARRLAPNRVLRAGRGTTLFGIPGQEQKASAPERSSAEKKLAEIFGAAGLSLQPSNEIETVMYRKLLINAVINPLTALWRIENGELLASEERMNVMRCLFDEIMSVYSAAGIAGSGNWWQDLLDVCRATARNRSSMLEDVSHGRKTEVDWISGGVAGLAERFGTEAPMNRMLRDLVRGMP